MINLPNTIESIKFGNGFSSKIYQLPKKLKVIIISSKYKYLSEFKTVWKNYHQINESHGLITFVKNDKKKSNCIDINKNLNQEITKSLVDSISYNLTNFIKYIQYDIFE